jgi:hypothetical protein
MSIFFVDLQNSYEKWKAVAVAVSGSGKLRRNTRGFLQTANSLSQRQSAAANCSRLSAIVQLLTAYGYQLSDTVLIKL